MITPTNISKNPITPTGVAKSLSYYWGDPNATWGDAIATWGSNYVVTNIVKNTPTSTTTVVGSPIGLLLTLTYATAITSGGGWTNQPKS